MIAESNVPAIRFKGFSGEWVSTVLGQLLNITSAARVHKDEWVDDGVPFFRTSDVVSIYKGLENKKAYISFDLYKELSAKSGAVKKDDLLITGGGSIGIPYLIATNEPLYFKDADLLWLKNSTGTNGYFLFTFFSSQPFRKYISGISHIGTISHYTIEQAKSTPISVSHDKEQTKIGNYFQQFDTLIAQHQQKHDKLLSLKKSLLEKMFPKQDEKVPEIRFKGFGGGWKEDSFSDISESFEYGLNAAATEYDGENKYIRITDIDEDTRAFDHGGVTSPNADLSKADNYKLKLGDILFARTGASTGKTYIYREQDGIVYFAGFLIRARIKKEVDTEFVFQSTLTKMYLNFIRLTSQRSGQPGVNALEYGSYKIFLPSSKEQNKIGDFFKSLDTLINQHQAQLKKLNNIKQACLEKMFV